MQITHVSLLPSDVRELNLGFFVGSGLFRETLKQHLNGGEMPSKESIVEIMKLSKLYNIESDTTYFRRASTIFDV